MLIALRPIRETFELTMSKNTSYEYREVKAALLMVKLLLVTANLLIVACCKSNPSMLTTLWTILQGNHFTIHLSSVKWTAAIRDALQSINASIEEFTRTKLLRVAFELAIRASPLFSFS